MPETPRPPSSRDELRTRVHARAKQLRFRRRLQITGALVSTAALIATLAGVALLSGDPVNDLRDAASEPTTAATPQETTGPAAGVDLAPVPTPVPTPVATPFIPPCRNSFEPECGAFRWDPEPKNEDMTVEIKVEPASPRVGEKVTFVATITDDSPAEPHASMWGYGDGPAMAASRSCDGYDGGQPYGPWTPPEPTPTVSTAREYHTYKEPGTYQIQLEFGTGTCLGDGPYGGGQLDPYASLTVGRTSVEVGP